MKTNVLNIEATPESLNTALDEIEKYCNGNILKDNKKAHLQMRLLGEETICLIRDIAGKNTISFWIEGNGKKNAINLEMTADTGLDTKEELMKLSKSGKNISAKGILGKIKSVIEDCMYGFDEANNYLTTGMMYDATLSYGIVPLSGAFNQNVWSLNQYRSELEKDKETREEDWNEIERSIIANVADDVLIGALNCKIKVIIKKSF